MRADRGHLRTLRAGVFAGSAVGLAAAAHQLGGGSVTGAGALTGFLAVLLVARPLAGRARRLPGALTGTALSQLGLHLLLEAWSVDASCQGSHAAHAMHCSAGSMSHTSGSMIAGHALATLALALLLTQGERALWAFLALLGLRPPPVGFAVPDAGSRVAEWISRPRPRNPAPAISRRGPPRFLRLIEIIHDRRKPCAREVFSPS